MTPKGQQLARDLAQDWQAMNEEEQRAALLKMDAADCAMLATALAFVECEHRAAPPVRAKRASMRDVLMDLNIESRY